MSGNTEIGNTNLDCSKHRMYLGPSSFEYDEDEQDPLLVYYRNVHQNNKGGRRNSGTGILEFSTAKAGQDVTPARFDFGKSSTNRKRRSGTMHSLAGALSSVTNLAFSAAHHASGSPGSSSPAKRSHNNHSNNIAAGTANTMSKVQYLQQTQPPHHHHPYHYSYSHHHQNHQQQVPSTSSSRQTALPRQASLGAQLGAHLAAKCMTGVTPMDSDHSMPPPLCSSSSHPYCHHRTGSSHGMISVSAEPLIRTTTAMASGVTDSPTSGLSSKLEQIANVMTKNQLTLQARLDQMSQMLHAMLLERAGDQNMLHQLVAQLQQPIVPSSSTSPANMMPAQYRHFSKKIKHSFSATFSGGMGRTTGRLSGARPPLRNTQSLSEHCCDPAGGGLNGAGDASNGPTVGSSACSIETSDIDLDDFEELSGSFNFREFDVLFEESHAVESEQKPEVISSQSNASNKNQAPL